jgi:hypothetical protein
MGASSGSRSMGLGTQVSDVLQLLCRLSEAPSEIFRVDATGREWGEGLRILADLGAVGAGPRLDSITCQACDTNHFAAIEFDAEAKGYIYFCPEAGWVEVDDADLATLRFHPEWLVDWLIGALAMPNPVRRGALLPGRLWHLGDTLCGGTLVTVVFARWISSQAALDELASMLGTIHVADKGLVITTSPQAARRVRLPHGFAFLDLREIGQMVGQRLKIDQARLATFVHALAGRVSLAKRTTKTTREARREPARLDYRETDRPLIAEMHAMILAKAARNATDASRAIARRAVGSKNEASKAARLAKRYRELYRSD